MLMTRHQFYVDDVRFLAWITLASVWMSSSNDQIGDCAQSKLQSFRIRSTLPFEVSANTKVH